MLISPLLLQQFQSQNFDDFPPLDSQTIFPESNVSFYHIEKSLLTSMPDLQIEKVNISENSLGQIISIKQKTVFNFNVEPFKDLIGNYFLFKVEKYILENESERNALLNSPLFHSQQYKKESVSIPLSKSNQRTFGNKVEYVAEVKGKELNIDFVAGQKPNYVLHVCSLKFDENKFQRDFDLNEDYFSDSNDGKSIALSLINNQGNTNRIYNYVDENEQDWQGATNEVNDERYTYSKLQIYSKKVFLRQHDSNNLINRNSNISNLLDGLLFNPNQRFQTPSFINVHEKNLLTNKGIQLFFDLDWLNLAKKHINESFLIDKNKTFLNDVAMKSIKLKRDGSDIGSFAVQTGQKQDVENQKCKIQELFLNHNSDYVKSYSIIDKSVEYDKNYQYSIELVQENNIQKTIKERQKQLFVLERDVEEYSTRFADTLDNSGTVILEQSERNLTFDKYNNNIKTLFDSVALITDVENQQVDVEQVIFSSNPRTGTTDGISSLKSDVKKVSELYNQIAKSTNKEVPGKKIGANQSEEIKILIDLAKNVVYPSNILTNNLSFDINNGINTINESIQQDILLQSRDLSVNAIKLYKDEQKGNKEQQEQVNIRNQQNLDGLGVTLEVQEQPFLYEKNNKYDKLAALTPSYNIKEARLTIFDKTVGDIDLSVPLLELFPQNDEQRPPIIEYLSGFERYDGGISNIKRPIWLELEENAINNVLCRIKGSNKNIVDRYFIYKQEEKQNIVNISQEVTLDVLREYENKIKLDII